MKKLTNLIQEHEMTKTEKMDNDIRIAEVKLEKILQAYFSDVDKNYVYQYVDQYSNYLGRNDLLKELRKSPNFHVKEFEVFRKLKGI